MGLPNKIIQGLGINLPPRYQWLGSAILGVLVFAALTGLIWLIIATAHDAAAGEEVTKDGWLVAGETYLLVEQERADPGHVCQKSNRDLNSNLGADLTIYKHRWIEWHARLTHHSCAFGPDAPDYNAAGMGVVFRFTR